MDIRNGLRSCQNPTNSCSRLRCRITTVVCRVRVYLALWMRFAALPQKHHACFATLPNAPVPKAPARWSCKTGQDCRSMGSAAHASELSYCRGEIHEAKNNVCFHTNIKGFKFWIGQVRGLEGWVGLGALGLLLVVSRNSYWHFHRLPCHAFRVVM